MADKVYFSTYIMFFQVTKGLKNLWLGDMLLIRCISSFKRTLCLNYLGLGRHFATNHCHRVYHGFLFVSWDSQKSL